MTTLKDLEKIKKLTQRHDDEENSAITAVRLVQGYNDSFSKNTEGGITALSLTESNLETLELGTEATALQYLSLSGNKSLKKVLFEIALPQLTHLYLDNCALEEMTIPAGFTALKQIYVQKNQLKKVAFEGDCPELVLLDASDNELSEFNLPFSFNKLEYLYLKGENNTIQNIPKEIVESAINCCEAVKAFFRASLQSGDILNQEAKCIFLGNGRAGKTTLSHQLRKGEFDPNIQYTHGILIKEWEIKQQDFPNEITVKINQQIQAYKDKRGDTLEYPLSIQLNIWDFGGQEYFHATHRLFLNSNVLYLLVWEEKTNKQDEGKGDYPETYWINNIKHYAPQNITLNIQNKERDRAIINYKEGRYKVAARHETEPQSLKKYELDIDELKKGILAQLSNLEYLCVPIPKLYDDIRQELRNIKTEKPYLLFEDYRNLCQRIDQTPDKIMQNESDIKSLTTFLHETGCLICYRYDDKKKNDALDNYVFINPQWVTETIYHILDEKTLAENGEFDYIHVANVLSKNNNIIQNVAIWIDLMTEFELIFNKKDTENHYITPQYLPKKCTDLSEKAFNNLNTQLPHKLILRYPDFLPKSIISRFICRYGNLSKDYYWKYGIVIHQDGEEAFVYCNYAQKEITIQTHSRLSELAVKLFDTLRGIDDTNSLEIAVPNAKDLTQMVGFVNFKKLKERADKRKFDVEWNGQEFEVEPFKPLLGREHETMKELLKPENIENMTQQEAQAQVQTLIGNAKIDKAIEVIENWAKQNNAQELGKSIAVIKSNYTKLKKEENLGIERHVNYTPITYGILNLDWTTETNPSTPPILPVQPTQESLGSSNDGIVKVLFFGANPFNTGKLNLKGEYAEIAKRLEDDKIKKLKLNSKFSTTLEDFQVKSAEHKPNIIHFAGHGKDEDKEMSKFAHEIGLADWRNDAGLVFFDREHTKPIYINGDTLDYNLEILIEDDKVPIEIVIFNACFSVNQAEVIAKRVKYVIGVNNKILDGASIDFTAGFYRVLAETNDVKSAFRRGKGLALPKLENRNQIVLYIDGEKTDL